MKHNKMFTNGQFLAFFSTLSVSFSFSFSSSFSSYCFQNGWVHRDLKPSVPVADKEGGRGKRRGVSVDERWMRVQASSAHLVLALLVCACQCNSENILLTESGDLKLVDLSVTLGARTLHATFVPSRRSRGICCFNSLTALPATRACCVASTILCACLCCSGLANSFDVNQDISVKSLRTQCGSPHVRKHAHTLAHTS